MTEFHQIREALEIEKMLPAMGYFFNPEDPEETLRENFVLSCDHGIGSATDGRGNPLPLLFTGVFKYMRLGDFHEGIPGPLFDKDRGGKVAYVRRAKIITVTRVVRNKENEDVEREFPTLIAIPTGEKDGVDPSLQIKMWSENKHDRFYTGVDSSGNVEVISEDERAAESIVTFREDGASVTIFCANGKVYRVTREGDELKVKELDDPKSLASFRFKKMLELYEEKSMLTGKNKGGIDKRIGGQDWVNFQIIKIMEHWGIPIYEVSEDADVLMMCYNHIINTLEAGELRKKVADKMEQILRPAADLHSKFENEMGKPHESIGDREGLDNFLRSREVYAKTKLREAEERRAARIEDDKQRGLDTKGGGNMPKKRNEGEKKGKKKG